MSPSKFQQTTSNKKLQVTSASLLVTSALLLVTRSYNLYDGRFVQRIADESVVPCQLRQRSPRSTSECPAAAVLARRLHCHFGRWSCDLLGSGQAWW